MLKTSAPFFALTIKVGPLEIMKTNLKYTKNSTLLNKMNLTNNKNNLYTTTPLDKLMNGVPENPEIKIVIDYFKNKLETFNYEHEEASKGSLMTPSISNQIVI